MKVYDQNVAPFVDADGVQFTTVWFDTPSSIVQKSKSYSTENWFVPRPQKRLGNPQVAP